MIVWTHYRMNDYVGPGIFATVTWARDCIEGRKHLLGLLTHRCVRCGETAAVEYERR